MKHTFGPDLTPSRVPKWHAIAMQLCNFIYYTTVSSNRTPVGEPPENMVSQQEVSMTAEDYGRPFRGS